MEEKRKKKKIHHRPQEQKRVGELSGEFQKINERKNQEPDAPRRLRSRTSTPSPSSPVRPPTNTTRQTSPMVRQTQSGSNRANPVVRRGNGFSCFFFFGFSRVHVDCVSGPCHTSCRLFEFRCFLVFVFSPSPGRITTIHPEDSNEGLGRDYLGSRLHHLIIKSVKNRAEETDRRKKPPKRGWPPAAIGARETETVCLILCNLLACLSRASRVFTTSDEQRGQAFTSLAMRFYCNVLWEDSKVTYTGKERERERPRPRWKEQTSTRTHTEGMKLVRNERRH